MLICYLSWITQIKASSHTSNYKILSYKKGLTKHYQNVLMSNSFGKTKACPLCSSIVIVGAQLFNYYESIFF